MNTDKMGKLVVRLYHFLFPIYGGTLFVITLYFLIPSLFIKVGTILFLYLVPPAGKESMVPALVVVFSPLYGAWSILIAAALITIIDSLVAWWTIWNWDLLKYIPLVGTYVKKIEKIGEKKWRNHPVMRKFAYAGLAAFVAIPFQGSGGFTAAIIGRLLGMHEYRVLLSIVVGSFAGSSIIGILAFFSILSFRHWGIFAIGGIIIFVAVIIIVYLWLRGEKNEDNGDWWSRIHRKSHR
ncbi:small multi-drug export protein [Aciduliprofundum sp. MAR08-339]|uniref:small multi-drug export protein n=1 Tax=Aciduliprofundum sp. (strain MAR08-339) TaxID=673860 RepID=UPI00064F25B8